MNEALPAAAIAMLARDALRRDPPPLSAGCEHDMRPLPTIDMRVDVACAKCGGWSAGWDADTLMKVIADAMKARDFEAVIAGIKILATVDAGMAQDVYDTIQAGLAIRGSGP